MSEAPFRAEIAGENVSHECQAVGGSELAYAEKKENTLTDDSQQLSLVLRLELLAHPKNRYG